MEEAEHRRHAFERRVYPAIPLQQGLFSLKTLLQLQDKLMGSNAITCTGVEGLCILLRRLAYPNRLTDLVPIFGLHPTHLSVMFNLVLEHVHSNFQHLISNLDQPRLEGQVRRYALVTQNARLLFRTFV